MDNRLDFELVRRGIATGRERAKEYIKSGAVTVNGKTIIKAGTVVSDTDDIVFTGESLRYVGRGGLKLEAAISSFDIDLSGAVCCDIGASTGGFTDCMLQNGAEKVYAVDVGHGQLADKLVNDKRVVNLEGLNVKDLEPETLGGSVNFVASDLSFISCRFAIDAASRILIDGGQAVILIKPQFEVGKSGISKGGIVKDKKQHVLAITALLESLSDGAMSPNKLIPSPIKGGDGNIEYLILLVKSDNFTNRSFDIKAIVDAAFASSK